MQLKNSQKNIQHQLPIFKKTDEINKTYKTLAKLIKENSTQMTNLRNEWMEITKDSINI